MSGKRIVWFLPSINGGGSGGLQTIFRHIVRLGELGANCSVCCVPTNILPHDEVVRIVDEDYGCRGVNICADGELEGSFDLAIATENTTVEYVLRAQAVARAYFVQDFEPWFYPMGTAQLRALASYRAGLVPITIGNWLGQKLSSSFGTPAYSTCFGADLSQYHPIEGAVHERAICAIWQPHKPWRCMETVEQALRIVHELSPETNLYLYGSGVPDEALDGIAIQMGILTKEQCNELYNLCSVGLCMSASNPSRIPFEMMAAGLPVVDLNLENNLYDYPADVVSLAEFSPEAIATALLGMLDDPRGRDELGALGARYMREYPIGRELDEFAQAVAKVVAGELPQATDLSARTQRAVQATPEALHAGELVRSANRESLRKEREQQELQFMMAARGEEAIEGRYITVSLEVEEPMRLSEVQLRVLVWHDSHQEDIESLPLQRKGERFEAIVDLARHDNFSGAYYLHAYGIVDGEDQLICDRELVLSVPGAVTPDEAAAEAETVSEDALSQSAPEPFEARLDVHATPEDEIPQEEPEPAVPEPEPEPEPPAEEEAQPEEVVLAEVESEPVADKSAARRGKRTLFGRLFKRS
ncbi:MAG: hypothetical protein Q4B54_03490 [Coriobacteriales bacterium]|nr:hypothetical protein [Coriobacteriales bacterium]